MICINNSYLDFLSLSLPPTDGAPWLGFLVEGLVEEATVEVREEERMAGPFDNNNFYSGSQLQNILPIELIHNK